MNKNHKFNSFPAFVKSLNPKNVVSEIRACREERREMELKALRITAFNHATKRYFALRDIGTFEDMTQEQIDRILNDLISYELKVVGL